MRLGVPGSVSGLYRAWSRPERRLQVLTLAAGLAVVIGTTTTWLLRPDVSSMEYWKAWGYPGVFFLSFLGSGAMVLPVPGLIAVCGAGGLEMNLIAVGLLSGLGETLGEVSGYAIGYGGHSVIARHRIYHRITRWMERRGSLVIFLVSLVPNPFFDLIGIAAGGLRFPLFRFLGTVWLGKTLKGLIVAQSCFWIARWLPWGG